MLPAALTTLQQQQLRLSQLLGEFNDRDYARQFHPDLSPAGWHLGHCVYTEDYWLHEVVLGNDHYTRDQKSFYTPELSPKQQRGQSLPDRSLLQQQAAHRQAENLSVLADHLQHGRQHQLLGADYLPLFLAQHYAQHAETVCMIRQLAKLEAPQTLEFKTTALQPSTGRNPELVSMEAAHYPIGSQAVSAYDNEKPQHDCYLEAFQIARLPVSNADFLGFILGGGYDRPSLWDTGAWQWKQQQGLRHPLHWRQDSSGNWYAIGLDGAQGLQADQAVYGLSHHEALAFARWAGARLPTEQEWEAARNCGRLEHSGQAWEWCANTLQAYAGFKAWPYEGYSAPYFDAKHFVLRGGSLHTQAIIKRPSFRNYYEAHKRHIFAGLRLAR